MYREKDDSALLMFVSLFGTGILVGPSWAKEAAQNLTDAELASHAKLMEISAPYGGQALGEAELYYCDTAPPTPSLRPTASRQQEHAIALENICLPDDSAEVGLSEMESTFVLLSDCNNGPQPLAGAGYDIWEGKLAHLGVLTAPEKRQSGFGSNAVAIAMEQAMNCGLIPQWRARTDNTASIRTALRAGFEYVGTQTSVILEA
ncbi:GNAT family N-acetyltransferase [Arthrobacter sp. MYb214]|uniref:GNAT family N-acetyltransferase n=1 Tax=Arthrobacter sp. MYb214 TaxID=1848596 RepID=UPI000CFCBA2C|nr:GNAT family protein [Arthrobacter sp. MYb214]PRB76746.1 GNAT family N-acetyltransferase [Arthrobacter sp. MYb214]